MYSQSVDPSHPPHPPLRHISPPSLTGVPQRRKEAKLTHTLLIQAIELQPLRRRRTRSARPGNPLHGVQGMNEDAICSAIHQSTVYHTAKTRDPHVPTESDMLATEEAVYSSALSSWKRGWASAMADEPHGERWIFQWTLSIRLDWTGRVGVVGRERWE